jgi:phosphoribosylformimino-5-aminoimidazole carboxamide ribotide isomerase
MIFIPAIDLIEGRCVRLLQGDYRMKMEYSGDPVKTALSFFNQGAGYLHIVDLDAARGGGAQNRTVIGGGVRTRDDVVRLLDAGVERIILGTVVVKSPETVSGLIGEFGSKLAAGIDAREGMVKISGWTEEAGISANRLGVRARELGFSLVVYTDITRDGMMEGPNLEGIRIMAQETGLPVIAAGGVSGIEDVIALKSLEPYGVKGVISGKAIYEGALSVREACGILRAE